MKLQLRSRLPRLCAAYLLRNWGHVLLLLCCLLPGCIGVPNPLAPSLSGSVGLPHRGTLTGAASLPDRGPGYRRFRNDTVRWGSPRLIATIQAACAGVVSTVPRTPALLIGDLSQQRGGETERHRSHRSGRDADLLFYVSTPAGAPVPSPGFVRFGSDGLGEHPKRSGFLRFDVARNWELVRQLILSPESQVEWLFVARHLEGLLIEQATAIGEEPTLIDYAATVLKQPGDSAPHDDHFHLRLACSPDEAVSGCEGGPRWKYLPTLPKLVATNEELLAAILLDP